MSDLRAMTLMPWALSCFLLLPAEHRKGTM